MALADRRLIVSSPQPRTELHVPAYIITRVGRELLSLVAPPADADYLELVRQDLQARGMTVRVAELPRDTPSLEVG